MDARNFARMFWVRGVENGAIARPAARTGERSTQGRVDSFRLSGGLDLHQGNQPQRTIAYVSHTMKSRTMKHILTAALALSLLNGAAVMAQANNPSRNDQSGN